MDEERMWTGVTLCVLFSTLIPSVERQKVQRFAGEMTGGRRPKGNWLTRGPRDKLLLKLR